MIYGWETVALSQRQEAEGFILKVVRFSLRVTKTNRLGKNLRLLRRAVCWSKCGKVKKKKKEKNRGVKNGQGREYKTSFRGVLYFILFYIPFMKPCRKSQVTSVKLLLLRYLYHIIIELMVV